MDDNFLRPLELTQNPVYRFYRGGALLGAFRGTPGAVDGSFPEDWVGSITSARNPAERTRPNDGLSAVSAGGATVLLRDLVLEAPEAVAGPEIAARFGPTTGVLVKLLDSAMRLPIHCHPSREFARATLASPFGKAEAWIVLGTRAIPGAEPPNVRLGFRDEMPRDVLRDLIDRQDTATLLETLVAVPVEPGDVIFVPPGAPHAIGAGVFLAEVQEPSDFSVVAEWAGYPIDPADAHLGIGWERMIDCFDRRAWAGGVRGRGTEVAVAGAPRTKLTLLLGPDADEYFGAARLQVHDHAAWPFTGTFTVGIVVVGSGTVSNRFGTLSMTAGDSFTVIAGAPASELTGSLDIIVCTPPRGMSRFRR